MRPALAERLLELAADVALYPGGPMLSRVAVAACLGLAVVGAALEWLDAAPPPPLPHRALPHLDVPAAELSPQAARSSLRVLSTHVLPGADGEATLVLRLQRGAEAQVRLRVEGADVRAAVGPARVGAAGVELLGSGTVRLALRNLQPQRALRLRLVDAQGAALGADTGVEVAVLAVPAPPALAAAPFTVALQR